MNSIPVELKVTCRTPEVILLVEEALLSRLQDFRIEVPNNSATLSIDSFELTSKMQDIKINSQSGKF